MFASASAAGASAGHSSGNMLTLDLFTPNDDARPVFLTGSFNAWTTQDGRFQMNKVKDGHYNIHFTKFPPSPNLLNINT